MKKLLYIITLLTSCILLEPAYSDNPTKPLLVVDAKNKISLPRRFRQCTSSYLETAVQQLQCEGISIPTREGLCDLQTSACSQFSQKQLETIKKLTPGKLWIVDLREESHGYLNGEAISWYGYHNDTNKGLSLKEILAREHTLLDKLKALKTAVVYQIQLKIAKTISQAHANPTPVGSIMSEAKLARLENVNYIRFPVTDHHAPSPEIIQKFIDFYKNLPSDAYLLIHCRGGSGRSTFFMVLCDILKNGQNVSFKDMVYRQYLLGGRNMALDADSTTDLAEGSDVKNRFKILQTLYEQITGQPTDIS